MLKDVLYLALVFSAVLLVALVLILRWIFRLFGEFWTLFLQLVQWQEGKSAGSRSEAYSYVVGQSIVNGTWPVVLSIAPVYWFGRYCLLRRRRRGIVTPPLKFPSVRRKVANGL